MDNKSRIYNIWVIVALAGIIIPYGMYIFPFPTEEAFSHLKDVTERKAALELNLQAWYWSLTIITISLISAFMAMRSIRGWRPIACIGVLFVFINQNFPFTIFGLLFNGVDSINQFISRVSFFMGYPDLLKVMIVFDILVPLLCCTILYKIFLSIFYERKNTPSNKALHPSAKSSG